MLGKKSRAIFALVGAVTLLITIGFSLVSKSSIKYNSTNMVAECKKSQACYIEYVKNSFKAKGLDYTITLLTEAASKNGAVLDCHIVAHELGRVAYDKYGREILKRYIPICSEGFNHGVIDRASDTLPISSYADFFGRYCLKNPDLKTGCVHGIGHVLAIKKVTPKATQGICDEIATMIYKKYPLPSDPILASNIDISGSCVDGYVMENIDNKGKVQILSMKESYCKGFTGSAEYYCIFEYSRAAVRSSGVKNALKNLDLYHRYCASIKDNYYIAGCGFSMGEVVEELYHSKNPRYTIDQYEKNCQGSEIYSKSCTIGFISKMVNFNIINENSPDYCDIKDESLKEYCRENLASLLRNKK